MMTFDVEDTIAAIASAEGMGARGIIRVSGPDLMHCLSKSISCDLPYQNLRSATAFRAEVLDRSELLESHVTRIPCEVYLWPSNRSYTRQPSAELHLINSRPLLDCVLTAIIQAGARLAKPGEFTQRAFLAGRIDLPQAEAVLGVIDAHSQRELQLALRQLAGGLSNPVATVRMQLLDLLADLEAGLDFVEEDIQFVSAAEIESRLSVARQTMIDLLQKLHSRSTIDRLSQCVLIGEPNVGKSSLLNALRGHDAAIVSDISGTTRDYVAERILLDPGTECRLVDTAGLKGASPGNVEADEGIDSPFEEHLVTHQQWDQADVVLVCIDGSRPISPQTNDLVQRCRSRPHLILRTKSDLPCVDTTAWKGLDELQPISVSTRTMSGIEPLRAAISRKIKELSCQESAVVRATAARCQEAFQSSSTGLARALQIHSQRLGDELVAAELRTVLDDLGQIAGTVYTEDLLDRIFSRFCIGK